MKSRTPSKLFHDDQDTSCRRNDIVVLIGIPTQQIRKTSWPDTPRARTRGYAQRGHGKYWSLDEREEIDRSLRPDDGLME